MLSLEKVKNELKTFGYEYANNILCGHTKSILIYINGGTTRIIHAVQNNVLKYNAVDVISINAEICIYSFVQRYDCDLLFSIANYAVFDDVYSATESDGISILGGSNRGLQFLQR